MKKIMYVHHGDIKGGAPMSLRFLLDKIDNAKYKTIVVCRVNESDASFFAGANTEVIVEKEIKPFHGSTVSGIDWKQIGYNFYYALPTYFAMKKIVKEYRPDVVHLNSTCLFMCAKAVKSVDKSIRVICHVREPLLPNIWGDILKVMSNRYCDRFIAIDEYDRNSVDPQNKKSEVIYNFVDFAKFDWTIKKNVIRTELSLSDETIIYLVLARISAENGILELVSAWKNGVQDYKSQLVIVGEIPGREEIYTSKCHEVADGTNNIHIMPFRTDTVDVISSSDIMVCPFVRPHFARMIVEGAAMKKPSLSNDIDGPKELIVDNETGLFYNNVSSLIDQVNLLTSNRLLREKMGENAYKRAIQLFNADINADKTFALYE